MAKGRLIVMEGACDGIGKTTQYTLLKEHLEKNHQKLVTHHFPSYHTYQGEPVERYLRGEYGSPLKLSPYFINSLYAMDRAITWQTELKKEYEAGKIILLDRYTTSSMIYQSSVIEDLEMRKKFINDVCDYEYDKLEIQKPDQVLFLYAPFDTVTQLREARKENDGVMGDIHEKDLSFMKKVYDNAMILADYLDWEKIDCSSHGQLESIQKIHEKVYQKVKSRL